MMFLSLMILGVAVSSSVYGAQAPMPADLQGVPGAAGTALEIGKIICTPEDSHDTKWFKCIECCQSINTYHLNKKGAECNREARLQFCSNQNLNPETRELTCVGMQAYNLVLKNVVIQLKGDLKDECKTSEGMQNVFKDKIACFKACAARNYKHPSMKKYCPTFK